MANIVRIHEAWTLGSDEQIKHTLSITDEDGVVTTADLENATNITVVLTSDTNTFEFDLDSDEDAFDVTEGDGVLLLKLNEVATVTLVAGYYRAVIGVYDATNDDGLFWPEWKLTIK